jgi:hypothetical protein
MITPRNGRKDQMDLSGLARAEDEKPAGLGKVICWQAYSVNHQVATVGGNSREFFFERTNRECC